jgi:hypothetical protein
VYSHKKTQENATIINTLRGGPEHGIVPFCRAFWSEPAVHRAQPEPRKREHSTRAFLVRFGCPRRCQVPAREVLRSRRAEPAGYGGFAAAVITRKITVAMARTATTAKNHRALVANTL